MIQPLTQRLKIRSTVSMAGEVIPFYWPMRNFVHTNPLFGLEDLHFADATEEAARLFHARHYLPRPEQQRLLAEGKIDVSALEAELRRFLAARPTIDGIDRPGVLLALLRELPEPIDARLELADAGLVQRALAGAHPAPNGDDLPTAATLAPRLQTELLDRRPVYEAVDTLFGTSVGADLDERLTKILIAFFDEGQSVFSMPGRTLGLFRSWRKQAAQGRCPRALAGIIDGLDEPEDVIAQVMAALEVPEAQWMDYFAVELAKLHGWSGFIRWRANAKDYYWSERYPADLVDLLAVRLALGLACLREIPDRHGYPVTQPALAAFIADRPAESYLRRELQAQRILPAYAARVSNAIADGATRRFERLFNDYLVDKAASEAVALAGRLRGLARAAGMDQEWLAALETETFSQWLDELAEAERREGLFWLRATEAAYIDGLLEPLSLTPEPPRDKPPFVQAMFCIDVRSERIRRHLEQVGDYQTFGIAGFFGVPVSFIALGKGHESYLCPIFVRPRNLALEMTPAQPDRNPKLQYATKRVVNELKHSIFSPFVTVEAIGLLFGFDMVGKTLAPLTYGSWRSQRDRTLPTENLLIDNITRTQADSVVRTLQRAMIVEAVEKRFGIQREEFDDEIVKDLRETAMRERDGRTRLAERFSLDEDSEAEFIAELRRDYRIDRRYAQLQLERLARIGFSLDQQVHFVSNALLSIGLTQGFSRLVLLVGHGSTSDNNPYESALDCGACGGQQGLVSARVLAMMANKVEVRERLRQKGINVPEDTRFIPALHDTTTDAIELFDLDRLPPTHLTYLPRLRSGLAAAGRLCASERLAELDKDAVDRPSKAESAVRRRSSDWAQVRPEWGLSRNAGFVIGSRSLTRAMNLEGRVFLHSYDYRQDPRGQVLETILSGPLLVAQWINLEHYFSTVDNEVYGSGSKVYHNVVGRFAVMTGNLSDIRTGLPSQTVLGDGRPYHEPLRLITVIEAPFEFAERALSGIPKVNALVRNEWIRPVIVDAGRGSAHVFEQGQWIERPLRGTRVSSNAEEEPA